MKANRLERLNSSHYSNLEKTRDSIVAMLEALTLGTILFYIYLAVAGIVGLMTFVLFYHWVRYNPGVISTILVMAVY